MPAQDDGTGTGNAPNRFAQVGMGGSQGGGQFEQGEGQSGSLHNGASGSPANLTDNSGNSDAARIQAAEEGRSGGQQEQAQPRSDLASDEDQGDDSVGG